MSRQRHRLPFALTISMGLSAMMLSKAEAQVSLDAVLKRCNEKTIVAFGTDENGKWVKVGENFDDYCRGILDGMFAVLLHTQKICTKETAPTPDFLLSIVLTYRNETKTKDNNAVSVIETAFKRAFSCAK
jgi:hypothetical protein